MLGLNTGHVEASSRAVSVLSLPGSAITSHSMVTNTVMETPATIGIALIANLNTLNKVVKRSQSGLSCIKVVHASGEMNKLTHDQLTTLNSILFLYSLLTNTATCTRKMFYEEPETPRPSPTVKSAHPNLQKCATPRFTASSSTHPTGSNSATRAASPLHNARRSTANNPPHCRAARPPRAHERDE